MILYAVDQQNGTFTNYITGRATLLDTNQVSVLARGIAPERGRKVCTGPSNGQAKGTLITT